MRIINIKDIIEEIKLEYPSKWSNYVNLLSTNNSFGSIISDEELYTEKGIINLKEKKLCLKKVSGSHSWWIWENGKKRNDIKFILEIFEKKIIDKVKFCPYCGKIPLISYGENKDKRGYDLDHIYPWQNKYNYLAFNLFNLVPACKMCNNIKKAKDLADIGDYYHPYFGHIKDDKLTVELDKDFNSAYNFINFKSTLLSEHAKFFTLKDIYENAHDTALELAFIIEQESKIMTYSDKFDLIGIQDKRSFFFMNYYPENPDDILKYSNGKIKRDMIKSLKI